MGQESGYRLPGFSAVSVTNVKSRCVGQAESLSTDSGGKSTSKPILAVCRIQLLQLKHWGSCSLAGCHLWAALSYWGHLHSLPHGPFHLQVSKSMSNPFCALNLWLPSSLTLRRRLIKYTCGSYPSKGLMWLGQFHPDNLPIFRSTDLRL